jgi:hypothetical protein
LLLGSETFSASCLVGQELKEDWAERPWSVLAAAGRLKAVTLVLVVPLPFFHIFIFQNAGRETRVVIPSNQDSDDPAHRMSRGYPLGAMPESLRRETSSRQITALLSSLWGREKIKFEHLRETKDLAATSTEKRRENCIPETTATQGRRPWYAPRGGWTDLSQFSSFAGFVLPGRPPAIGKTTLRPALPSGGMEPGFSAEVIMKL